MAHCGQGVSDAPSSGAKFKDGGLRGPGRSVHDLGFPARWDEGVEIDRAAIGRDHTWSGAPIRGAPAAAVHRHILARLPGWPRMKRGPVKWAQPDRTTNGCVRAPEDMVDERRA